MAVTHGCRLLTNFQVFIYRRVGDYTSECHPCLNFYTTKVRKKVELRKLFNTFNTLWLRMLKTLICLHMSNIMFTFATDLETEILTILNCISYGVQAH